jgi:hypothetical protein
MLVQMRLKQERKRQEAAAGKMVLTHQHSAIGGLLKDIQDQLEAKEVKKGRTRRDDAEGGRKVARRALTIETLANIKAQFDADSSESDSDEEPHGKSKVKNGAPARQRHPNKEIRGILIYISFIIVYMCSSMDYSNPNIYFFSSSLKSQFLGVEMQEQFSPTFAKTFDHVATVEELYHWFQSGFTHSAFLPNTFDSSDRLAGMVPGYTLGTNKILGAIRISQSRLERSSCSSIPAALAQSGHEFKCLESSEPTAAFGNLTFNGSSYQFERSGTKLYPGYEKLPGDTVSKERAMDFSRYTSKRLEIAYEAPAWSVVLDPTAPLAVNSEAILALVDGKYIDLHTTAVFVDFAVYNPGLDHMCVVKLVAELPPGGGVYTSSEFHVIRVYSSFTAEDQRTLVLHATVGLFYAYFLAMELKQLANAKSKCAYLQSPGNILILFNVVFYVAGILFALHIEELLPSQSVDATDSSSFRNYWPSAQCARLVIQLASANCFINFFQGVEHLSYVPTFALLSDTIKTAGPDLLSFSFVFGVIGYGFTQAHTMVFRDRLEGYRSLKHSMYSLMSSLLGDFNFSELYEADATLGPFFFVFYVLMAVFVVLNMVIAIISDAYSECSAKMKQKDEVNLAVEITDYLIATTEAIPWGVGARFRKHRLQLEMQVRQAALMAQAAQAKIELVAAQTAAKASEGAKMSAALAMTAGPENRVRAMTKASHQKPRLDLSAVKKRANGRTLGPSVLQLELPLSPATKVGNGDGPLALALEKNEQIAAVDPAQAIRKEAQALKMLRAKEEHLAHSVSQMLVSEMDEMEDQQIELLLERQGARLALAREKLEQQHAELDFLLATRTCKMRSNAASGGGFA